MNLTRDYQSAYCVQYNESDYQFFRRITAEDGLSFFSSTSDRHRLIVWTLRPVRTGKRHGCFDPGTGRRTSRTREWNKTSSANQWVLRLLFRCRTAPDRALRPRRNGHGRTCRQRLYRRTVRDAVLRAQPVPGGYSHRYDGIGSDGSTTIHQSEFEKIGADKDWLARVRLQEDQSAAFFVAGAGDCAQFCPGFKFTLTRHYDSAVPAGKDDLFLLTAVEHSGDVGGAYYQEAPGPEVYSNRFRGVPFALPYRPPQTPKPQITGPQTAVVVGPATPKSSSTPMAGSGRFHWQERERRRRPGFGSLSSGPARTGAHASAMSRRRLRGWRPRSPGDRQRLTTSIARNRPAGRRHAVGIKSCSFGGTPAVNQRHHFPRHARRQRMQVHSEERRAEQRKNHMQYVSKATSPSTAA